MGSILTFQEQASQRAKSFAFLMCTHQDGPMSKTDTPASDSSGRSDSPDSSDKSVSADSDSPAVQAPRKPRVILTKGLPGSGKSTWAKEQVAKYPDRYKRVNKDDLRDMLHNGKFSKANERSVERARDSLILLFVDHGFDVIIDDTNLASRHLEHISQLVQGVAKVRVQDFTDVSIADCIKRDLQRSRSVGEKVIRDMHKRHLEMVPTPPEYDPELDDCIVVDLDGTLAIISDRSPYDAARCEQDKLNEPVASVVAKYERVLLCSGRQSEHREPTERWLMAHNIRYDQLLMRATGDNRQDSIVKEELYREHIEGRWNVLFVLDDRQQVVDTWRRLGLTCLQVAPGDF
jgi:predicted kinase